MIIDGNNLQREAVQDAEYCIVGGGPAGITLALELSKHSDNIVLLESGGENYTPEAQELYNAAVTPDNYPDPGISRLRFLGGASNHWANNTSPLDPIDFEQRDWVPNSGWPISYQDLNLFYTEAAVYCGTGSDGYEASHWSQSSGFEDVLADSKFLKTGIAKAANPPVRFYRQYGQQLKESTEIRVYINANMVDLDFDSAKERVSRVFFSPNNNDEKKHSLQAKFIIFAMGGIENARMMLYLNGKHDNQLGNQGDNVGRYFMDHPLPRAAIFYANDLKRYQLYQGLEQGTRRVLGFFSIRDDQLRKHKTNNLRMPLVPSSNYILSDGISSYHLLTKAATQGELPDSFGLHLSNIFSDIDMVSEAISRRLLNKKIFDYADDFGGFQIPMMMEQTPHRDNRVYLSNVKDRYGIPRVLIDWEIKQADKDQLWKALMIAARGVGALSLGRFRLLRERDERLWGSQLGFGHHHMGTTRMADSASSGVVDKNLKVFGTSNLYIAGSSTFATGGHVPPTLTIVALCLRLASHLKAKV